MLIIDTMKFSTLEQAMDISFLIIMLIGFFLYFTPRGYSTNIPTFKDGEKSALMELYDRGIS